MRSIFRRMSVVTLAALFAVVIATPGAAHAAGPSTDSAQPSANEIQAMLGSSGVLAACPTDQNIRWKKFGSLSFGYRYTVISSTPAFYSSDGRSVDNLLDDPVSATFTSSVSRTTTITVSAGSSVQLLEVFQYNVSVTVVNSRTTAIGVNVTATVPPRTRVTGLYGVNGYDIVYDTQPIIRNRSNCTYGDVHQTATAAPTYIEGWQFSSTPL